MYKNVTINRDEILEWLSEEISYRAEMNTEAEIDTPDKDEILEWAGEHNWDPEELTDTLVNSCTNIEELMAQLQAELYDRQAREKRILEERLENLQKALSFKTSIVGLLKQVANENQQVREAIEVINWDENQLAELGLPPKSEPVSTGETSNESNG